MSSSPVPLKTRRVGERKSIESSNVLPLWYDVDLDLVDCEIKDFFFPSHDDDETEDFLQNCFEKSDWLLTQIFHALARSFMCWFMTRTSING
ncbi:uncharacterized protein TNCV_1626921 [Trichonephila clavipes]|nr:uncharacterized protein TNCV_1626921 [Trichonephila clavipes]